jgi:hypothetical protein
MRRKLWFLTPLALLAILLNVTLSGSALAFTRGASTPPSPQLNVTGTWNFATTDPNYPTLILNLQQNGSHLSGTDLYGQPVSGSVNGKTIRFKVTGASSEDNYGGKGTISPKAISMAGSFWDGFGGTGNFNAVNIVGTWNFTTTDSLYASFTLTLQQSGSQLSGNDQYGQPVSGTMSGLNIDFTVTGVSSEDDYGGTGTVAIRAITMAGSFWDGFGGGGTFKARRAGFI